MRYRVEWDPQCYPAFDAILTRGVTRERLKNAVRHVELELSEDALDKGRHLSEGLYKLDVLTVRVYFHVDETNQVATVDGIRWTADT